MNFTDFWPDFQKHDNYFVRLLAERYNLIVSDDPDVLFFSVFGTEHRGYRCLRIQYIGENIRPNYQDADYVLSFDYPITERNYRWPLYNLYCDPKEIPVWDDHRSKFCCMVVSNPRGTFRNQFYSVLNTFKPIDSGGKYLNNVGGAVSSKNSFLANYRFSLAFENSAFPGYTTEKLLEAKRAGTVPIYWGNPLVQNDFNLESFINVHGFDSIRSAVKHIIEIDSDPVLYDAIRRAPLLKKGEYTAYSDRNQLLRWLEQAIDGGYKHTRWVWGSSVISRFNSWRTDRFDRAVTRELLSGPADSDITMKG